VRTTTITAAIVGAISIAALLFFSQRAPEPGADAVSKQQSTPHPTDATPASPPRTPDAAVDAIPATNDAPAGNEGRDPLGAPLPQPSPPAPITEALDDLRLPPIPELRETERAFAAEAVDPLWSPEAEAHILGEIAQVTGLKLVTLQVECKTTLCRLHVAQQELRKGPGPILDIVARLGMKTRWVISVEDRNGVPTSLAYLERGSAVPGGPTPGVDDIEIRRSKAE
jgi:hypothetical protein